MIKNVSKKADKNESRIPPETPIKNIVIIAISVGKAQPRKRKNFRNSTADLFNILHVFNAKNECPSPSLSMDLGHSLYLFILFCI